MKMILLNPSLKEKKEATNINDLTLFLKPDSTLFREKKFYLADHISQMELHFYWCAKITQVGKNIQIPFAGNYYQEIAVGLHLVNSTLKQSLQSKNLPVDMAISFDDSTIISPFFEKKMLDDQTDLLVKKNEQNCKKNHFHQKVFTFEDVIVHASKFFTLKIGDLIFIPINQKDIITEVRVNDVFEIFINEKKYKRIKIN